MRSTTLVVLAFIPLTGCDWGFVSPFSSWGDDDSDWWGDTGGYNGSEQYFRDAEGMGQVSSLWNTAEGLAFDDQGSVGAASMWSVNCRFQTASGSIDVEDPDATEDDEIQDSCTDCGNGLTVAATSANAIRVTHYNDGGAQTTQTIFVPGATAARFYGTEIVYSGQDAGCNVGWTGNDREVRVGTLCGGFDASDTGTVFSTADGTVKVVTPAGTVSDLDIPGELIAWDSRYDQIYTALVGGDTVTAVSTSGTVRWTATLEGRITALTDMGSAGGVLVGLSVGDEARVSLLDGETGNEIAWGEASEAPTALWASSDGSTFAARVSYNTHFIRVGE